MRNHPSRPRPARITRTATALALATAAETAVTIGHFVYGARLYDDPGRLHVVAPALVALLLTGALTALFAWRPSKLALGALSVVVAVPFLAVFGLFHGA